NRARGARKRKRETRRNGAAAQGSAQGGRGARPGVGSGRQNRARGGEGRKEAGERHGKEDRAIDVQARRQRGKAQGGSTFKGTCAGWRRGPGDRQAFGRSGSA